MDVAAYVESLAVYNDDTCKLAARRHNVSVLRSNIAYFVIFAVVDLRVCGCRT